MRHRGLAREGSLRGTPLPPTLRSFLPPEPEWGGGEAEREGEGREDGREREEGEEERVKRVWMKGRRGKGGWREG